MLETKVINGDELPYRIDWGNLHSAGVSPAIATIRLLSIGGYLPNRIKDAKEAALYIFWNYQSFTPWAKIIHILDTNSFGSVK